LSFHFYFLLTEDIGRIYKKGNAAFIVKAVNCHDELVEALEKAEKFIGNLDPDKETYPYHELIDTVKSIEQALAKVEVK